MGKSGAPAAGKQSDDANLLGDITAFHAQAARLAPDASARQWLPLWDRGLALDANAAMTEYASFDAELSAPVGLCSVIAAMPAPAV